VLHSLAFLPLSHEKLLASGDVRKQKSTNVI